MANGITYPSGRGKKLQEEITDRIKYLFLQNSTVAEIKNTLKEEYPQYSLHYNTIWKHTRNLK